MKRLFHFTHRAALYLLLSFLVALALALSVLRFWLLPEAQSFRHVLEARIGELIHEQVHIEKLSARLYRFRPELSLRGLQILDASGNAAIRLADLRVGLDLWRSLRQGEPAFRQIRIVGTHLSVRRRPDGSFGIVGLNVNERPPAWLLADGRFELLDCMLEFQDVLSSNPPLPPVHTDIRLSNSGQRHRLAVDFGSFGGLATSLRLVVDARGDGFEAAGWEGAAYLEGRAIDGGRILATLRPSAFGLRSGRADFRIWTRWQGRMERVAGDVHLAAPVFVHHADGQAEQALTLAALGGRFVWRRESEGWRLDLARFRPAFREPWPETRVAVAADRRPDGTLVHIGAAASYLNLADLRAFLDWLPPDVTGVAPTVRALAPTGTLRDLRLFFAADATAETGWGLCAGFQDLSAQSWHRVPGFSGISGQICGDAEGGRLALSANHGALVDTSLGLQRPLPLNQAEAELFWRQTRADWTLDAPAVSVRNEELNARGRFRMVLDKRADAAPFVDASLHVSDADVAAVRHYLPHAIIPRVSQWLEEALVGGRVSSAAILFHGNAADFPFRGHDGVFEVAIDAEGTELRFHPDWLPLTQASAHLRFAGPGLEIDADHGLIGTGELVAAHASIADLDRTPWLHLAGKVRAGVADSLDYLAHSPIRRIPQRLHQYARTSGTTEITLNLAVPLTPGLGEITVDGTALFEDAALWLDPLDLEVGRVRGPLHFSRRGLSATGIRARILGSPASIRVASRNDRIRIDVEGQAGLKAMRERFPAEFWGRVQGESAGFDLELDIPESLDAGSEALRARLASDLSGFALDLPAPLGKVAGVPRALSIETEIQAGATVPLRVTYGQEMRARLRYAMPETGARLEGGEIGIGMPLPPASEEPGLAVSARVGECDAGAWLRAMAGGSSGDMGAPLLRQLDAEIARLRWNGRDLGRFVAELAGDGTYWSGHVDGTLAKGKIVATPEAVQLDLDHLQLPAPEHRTESPDQRSDPAGEPVGPAFSPTAVPSLDLKARKLQWRGVNLGTLGLVTERRGHGMIIKQLVVEDHTDRMDLHGDWTGTPERSLGTRLEGKLHLDNLGEFLARFGYAGQIRGTHSELDFTLNWPGAPQQFSAGKIRGKVGMKLGKGALLKIEPGLGRVIGILNLNTLWRRLSFDFSDLFGIGLAYDGVEGSFGLGDGQAVTKGFLIDAVSAKIVISGRAGLVAHDLDQTVVVIPHTSVALPIAGAVAGGPAVGAAVYVAQRLIGEEVDSITATQYVVRGSWDDPTITRISRALPFSVLDQAWSGLKSLSGFSSDNDEEEQQ